MCAPMSCRRFRVRLWTVFEDSVAVGGGWVRRSGKERHQKAPKRAIVPRPAIARTTESSCRAGRGIVVDHTNKKLPARAARRVWGSLMTRPLVESRARATPRRARRRARRSQQTTAVVSLGAASRRPSSSTCGGGAEAEHTAQTTTSACGNMTWALSQDIVARTLDRAELSEPRCLWL